jgi:hypothetical protein
MIEYQCCDKRTSAPYKHDENRSRSIDRVYRMRTEPINNRRKQSNRDLRASISILRLRMAELERKKRQAGLGPEKRELQEEASSEKANHILLFSIVGCIRSFSVCTAVADSLSHCVLS